MYKGPLVSAAPDHRVYRRVQDGYSGGTGGALWGYRRGQWCTGGVKWGYSMDTIRVQEGYNGGTGGVQWGTVGGVQEKEEL